MSRAIRAIRLALAAPLLALMRLVRPLILVRLVPLHSSRIGHFAVNTELYLCELEAGINTPPGRYLDICYFAERPLANSQLASMWARRLRVWPKDTLEPLFRLNQLIPGGAAHEAGQTTQSDRDVHNLLPRTAPHLMFSAQEQARGREILRSAGIPDDADIVCLIVRDNSYLRTIAPEDRYFDYHDYRDSDVESYRTAAEALADRGCYVFRMGASVVAPLGSAHPRVFDYAMSSMRSEFMDVYLGARCLFCLSSGTGYDSVPVVFRRPVAYVNLVPIGYLPTYTQPSLGLSKRFWLASEQRWLSLCEIFNRGTGFCLNSSEYVARNIELVENSPKEVADAALEMFERLKGTWRATPEDECLQSRFWRMYPTDATDAVHHRPLHGTIHMTYGAQFLRDHPEWLSTDERESSSDAESVT